jgi:hypothetical protein
VVIVSQPLRWGAVAVSVAALLSACGPVEAGSAAVVGDRRISAQELEQATAEINAFTGPDVPVSRQEILLDMILEPFIIDRIAKLGTSALVSDDDARRLLDKKVPHPSQAAVDVLRVNGSYGQVKQLGGDAANSLMSNVLVDLKKANIQVNPRFGTLDLSQLTIVPATRNWLAAPSTTSPTAPAGDGTSGQAPPPSPSPSP